MLDDDFAREGAALERERELNRRNSSRQENLRERMPPPPPKKAPLAADDPDLAIFNTPMDCVVAAASFFNKMKITCHPRYGTTVKLVNKALELQENMSTSSAKIYSKSHVSEKAESALRRHLEEGNGGPNTTGNRGQDEQAASSNVDRPAPAHTVTHCERRAAHHQQQPGAAPLQRLRFRPTRPPQQQAG